MRFFTLLFGIKIVVGGLPQLFENSSVIDEIKSVSSYLSASLFHGHLRYSKTKIPSMREQSILVWMMVSLLKARNWTFWVSWG